MQFIPWSKKETLIRDRILLLVYIEIGQKWWIIYCVAETSVVLQAVAADCWLNLTHITDCVLVIV